MTAQVTPLDPQSERGRELAAELTVLFDDIEDRIARDLAAAKTTNRRDEAA